MYCRVKWVKQKDPGNANRSGLFPEMPAPERIFQIFSSRMTMATRWNRPPDSRKMFTRVAAVATATQDVATAPERGSSERSDFYITFTFYSTCCTRGKSVEEDNLQESVFSLNHLGSGDNHLPGPNTHELLLSGYRNENHCL